MKNEILNQFEKIVNKDELKSNIIFYAIYLLIFECFKNKFIEDVKGFLCDISVKDGKLNYRESSEYIKIKQKKYNGKINIFVNTMQWLMQNGAMDSKEFQKLIDIRDDRNKIGHELLLLLSEERNKLMEANFYECIRIFNRIDKWWINNIEIPISADEIPSEYVPDEVFSSSWLLCEVILNTIYGDNSYKEIIERLKTDLGV
jgi:hypothetical protein